MGLLNDLANQGLITNTESKLANGLEQAGQRITIASKQIGSQGQEYSDPYLKSLGEQSDYLQTQIDKQNKLNQQSGILSYSNLTSTNPLVSVPTNLLNFGANVAGAVVDQFANTAGGINVSNANSLYSTIPDDIKDIYNRERLDADRNDNRAALTGIQNALAKGQINDLVGYNKQFKTKAELDSHLQDLTAKVNSKPVSEQERLRLDNPDGRVMATNSLLTPLRQSYRDVFNQINQNYKDDRRWRGDRAKGVDNFFGSRSWGNSFGTDSFNEDFANADRENAELNKQGQFQRANSEFGSSEYLEGVGKSVKAFGGSLKAAYDSIKDNPRALVDMAAETAPFLIGRTANTAFAGDALRVYADAGQDITSREKTAAVSPLQDLTAIAGAGAYTGLNLVERSTLLGALKGKVPGSSAVDDIASGMQSAASRITTRLADAVPLSVLNTARNVNAVLPTGVALTVAKNAALSGATEGLVEMSQQQIEDSWSKSKTDIDTSALAQAGVLGAALGATMSAPGSVVETLRNRVTSNAEQAVENAVGNTETQQNEDLLNSANPDYSPLKVVNRILATELPNQNYEGAKQQIDEIVANTNSQLSSLRDEVNYAENPEPLLNRIAAGEQILAKFVNENTAESNPNYDAIVNNYTSRIDALKETYARVTDPEFDIDSYRDSINKMQEALVSIEEPYNRLVAAQNNINQTANDEPVENESPTDEATRHLGAPKSDNARRMQLLSEDPNVPENLRNNLRVVATALLEANKAKDTAKVQSQAIKGDQGFRGTEQYITEMANAVTAGDTGRQDALTNQLNYFKNSRESKLAALERAQQLADSTGKRVQVVKPRNGQWQVVEGQTLPNTQFEKNNGLLVNPHRANNTGGIDSVINAIRQELDAINSTSNALEVIRNSNPNSFNSAVNDLRNDYMTDRNSSNPDPMQQALDDFNQVQRESNSWNENARSDLNFEGNNDVTNSAESIADNTGNGNNETGNANLSTEATGTISTTDVNGESNTEVTPTSPEQVVKADNTEPVSKSSKPKTRNVNEPSEAKAKEQPSKEKFNYRSKFDSKQAAKDYIQKHSKQDTYYVMDSVDGKYSIKKDPEKAKQVSASADAIVQIANDQNVPTANTTESAYTTSEVSEAATAANQTQELTADSIPEYESETKQETVKDASPEGAITPINTQGLSNTDFVVNERTKAKRLQNLISSGFIQRVKDGFNSPLVTIPNYVSSIKDRSRKEITETVIQFTGKEPTEAQLILINDFMNFNKAHGINKKLRSIVKANSNPEYNYLSYTDFLLNEQGQLDENTATAIILSMYSWIGENATSLYNDKVAIGKILRIKNADNIPYAVTERLVNVGSHQKTLASTLGQKAYQALQLKMLKDVDPVRQGKLEQALGTLAIGMMVDLGLAERTRITNGELYQLSEFAKGNDISSLDPNKLNDKAYTYFIRPAAKVDANGILQPTNFNKRILDLHKNTQGVLSALFGYEPYVTLPSLEPVKTLPNTFNEFGGKLPSMVRKALLKQQSLEYRLNVPMVEMTQRLMTTPKGQEAVAKILGYSDPMDRHKAFEKTVMSVNLGITRSLDLLDQTYQKVGSEGFYLPSTVWGNFRNGNPAGFNPQGDKIHRGFVSLANDLITVNYDANLNPFNEDNTLNDYGKFLRGLAFRMEDVKINGNAVDKTEVNKFIPQFNDYINSQDVQIAADSLNNLLEDNYTDSDLNNVSALLQSWEMGALGLSALMAINTRNQAIKSGAGSFDVYMAADSDGLVNGPAITNLLLNSGNALFNRSVGIIPFAKEGEEQIFSMQQLRNDPNARDPYEQLADLQKVMWDQLPRDNSPIGLAVRSLDYLDSDFGKRSGAKRALTPFNYGSGLDKVNIANARGTLEAIYKKIEQAGKDFKTDPNQAANISKAINVLIKYHNQASKSKVPFTTRESIADMNNMLTTAQENAILQSDISLRGDTTSKALSLLMKDYISMRNGKTALANSAFEVFNAIYESKLNQFEYDSVKEKLTAEEKQQLLLDSYEYMPTLATPMGIKSGEVEQSSIPMIDMGKRWNEDQTVEVKFNTAFGHKLTDLSSNPNQAQSKNGTTYLKSDVREKVFEAPGVGSLALFIQSHDAFVTYSVMQAMQAQNFHDANSTNAYNLVKMAQVQNKAFLEALTISNIGKAYSDAYTKVLKGFVSNMHSIDKTAQINAINSIQNTLKAHSVNESSFSSGLQEIYASYYQSDIDKLTNLAQQHSINQYATEGGGHVLTDADRTVIIAKRDELIAERDKAIKEIKVIGEKLDNELSSGLRTKQPKPVTLHDSLKANKDRFKDPKQLINHIQNDLAKYLNLEGNQGKYATMFNELLNISKQVLPSNLEVNILDGTQDTSKVLGYDNAITNGYSAWYSSDGKSNQINLRLDNDRLDTKTVVHEFIHAATSNSIAEVRRNPSKYPEAKRTVDKLERLMEFVKSKVTPDLDPVIQYGMQNLDEFIATGLTYPKLIEFMDSITDIPKEVRGTDAISTAFRSFVSKILDVLYSVSGSKRKYSIKTLSAYEALLLDTAELVSRNVELTEPTVRTMGAPRQRAINQVSEYTALEVFNSLDDGSLSPEFKSQLGTVITNVTDRLFSALPHKYARGNPNYSPDDIWNNALKNGKAPYTTAALKAGFKLSAQEQFGVEALEAALSEVTKSGSVSLAYKNVSDSFNKAKEVLKPSDFHNGNWNSASTADKAVAQQKYDYLFKVGKEDYITRFTALALASQEFNSMLNIKLERNLFANRGNPLFDKLIDMANHFMNVSNDRLTKTIGATSIQDKLPRLAQILVDIDLKNRNKSTNLIESTYLKVDDLANDGVNAVRRGISSALLNTPLANTNNKYVNIVTNTLKAINNGKTPISVFDEVRNLRNHMNPNKRLGFLGELSNEIGEQNTAQLLGEKMLAFAKLNEGTAQRIRTVVKQDVLSHFEDNGSKLSREDRANLTNGLLRTDIQSLLVNYTYEQVGDLISDRTMLNNEIVKLEKLVSDPVQISRTKSLAWYMVSGIGTETLAKNPTLIAQNAGLGVGLFTASDVEIKRVDDLASLYAIKYTDANVLKEAHKIMMSEYSRENKGGVYALVKYHEALARDSYNELFGNNIVSYTKGYLPNIMNPNKEVNVVTDKADIERLRSAMYTEIGTTGKSTIDPNGNDSIMFYSEDAGTQRYISGAMALYNYGRKGSEIDMTPQEFIDAQSKALSTLELDPSFDPRKTDGTRAIPTYNNMGNVIAYNYEMSSRVRDTYLERNNDFSEIMGEYTAAGFNKVNLHDQNIAVADALIDQFKTEYRKDPNGYIFVGAGVTDNTLAQSWAMMPKEIRNHIYNRTGMNGIYVHNQAYLTIFGNKKYSLTTAFDKSADTQNIAESLFTGFMKALFRDNARVRTAQGERMWQEAVHLLKDIVVIRNMTTALINIISNSLLLLTHGVSPKDIVNQSIEAVKAGMEYRKNSAELIKLQNRQRIEVGNADEIQTRINMLRQRIDRNPLKAFIDEGMFAGIVEDIDTDNQSYTYASGLQKKYEGVLDKIPNTVRQAGRFAFVQPGTPLYQFLHSATQYGDFSAKYVMYKHYTEKAKKRLTHDQAITMASNNFINYDVPTSKGMQYANDMGLLMFTKYNLRIQRALFEVLARRPASAIGQALIVNALSNLPPGIDPLFLNQIGNPLRNGPLGLLGALDEPFPIQMLF